MGSAVVISVLILFLHDCTSFPVTDFIDLTHNFTEQMPIFPGMHGWKHTKVFDTDPNVWPAIYDYTASEHLGTHFDAPYEFFSDKWTTAEVPKEKFYGPAVVIDITGKAEKDPVAEVLPVDLENWEKEHGRIPKNAIVIMNSGWGKYFTTDTVKYIGHNKTAGVGSDGLAIVNFPGFSGAAAEWLVKNREINGVGVDTLAGDSGLGMRNNEPVHNILEKNNVLIFENLNNVDKVPASGAFFQAFCLRFEKGGGAPCSVIVTKSAEAGALVPENNPGNGCWDLSGNLSLSLTLIVLSLAKVFN
jgi:kynurenine formamidase